MQDMATMQQHSITSPAPASTMQTQDSSIESVSESNTRADTHQESSRTDSENSEEALDAENENMNNESSSQANEPEDNEIKPEGHNSTPKTDSKDDDNDSTAADDGGDEAEGDAQEVEEGSTKYVCPICEAALASQHDFTLHIRSHNNDAPGEATSLSPPRGYACRICGNVLSSSSSLDRHVLVHSGERPFKCRVCGVAFTTNGNMHRHMRTHAGGSGSRAHNYESDGSTDSGGSLNYPVGCRKRPQPTSPPSGAAKRRKLVESNNNNNNNTNNNNATQPYEGANKRKVADAQHEAEEDGVHTGKRRVKTITSHQDYSTPQKLQCPVCEREDFASLIVLQMHLEECHTDDKITCHVCNLTFKNHRLLNVHRFKVHHHSKHDYGGRTGKKGAKNSYGESVFGFRDLTFVDFSSDKFPYIAKAVCEESLHKASSAFHKFQCDKCARAFPCGSALDIHRQTCAGLYGRLGYPRDGHPDEREDLSSSDGDAPTDLSSHRRKLPRNHWNRKPSDDGESEEDQRREDFFAGLDLQNKSVPSSPSVSSDYYRREDKYDNDSYFNAVHTARSEGGKDLADIQSILSVTSAGGFIQDLSKSPQPHIVNDLTPPDSALRGGGLSDNAGGEEEQQDCFAAEFRKMKLKGEFPCRLCTAVFPNLRALKGHNRSHLSDSSGVYRCNMCPYSNADKAVLVRHMRTHNGDRPYECALCNYAFTTKANCERHLRNRHSKLSRDEVKKSIIYHPSEDPINDPELQSKIASREEVKRSLVFNHNSSAEDLNNAENFHVPATDHLNEAAKVPQELSKLSFELDKPNLLQQKDSELSPPYSVAKAGSSPSPTSSNNEHPPVEKQIRPWEGLEKGRIQAQNEVEDTRDEKSDCETDNEEEGDISSIQALVNFTKNNNNNSLTNLSISDQRSNKDLADTSPSTMRHLPIPYTKDTAALPLDLSVVLDLSKKKDSATTTKELDDSEPQDLSKKTCSIKTEFNNTRIPPKYTPNENSQSNHSLLAQHIFNNLGSRCTTSPQSQSPNPAVPKLDVNAASFYAASPHLNSLYLNSNGFPFQSQPPYPLHPYFMSPAPHTLFSGSNSQDFSEMKERLQKELIRGLQLSGGTLLDPIAMASAAGRLKALHQQAFAELTRSKSDLTLSFDSAGSKVDDSKKLVPTTVTDVNEMASQNTTVTKLASPKINRDRESSSVKMVIKNGVLMPKQKQRRYRTERPFACEHCSARFTLRSNMERHIKQQHPQFWSQRQSRNIGPGAGRRSHSTVGPSLNQTLPSQTEEENITSAIHQTFTIPLAGGTHELIPNLNALKQETEKTPKIEGGSAEKVVETANKTKDNCSVTLNNNNNVKRCISEEVKLAIAQQLKSKLSQPLPKSDGRKQPEQKSEAEDDADVDEDDELIIDEEKEAEDDDHDAEKKQTKEPTKDEGVDLASVSKLLDNATTQTQAFQQYFRATQDGEEDGDYHRGEGSEEDEEGLVAGSNSEGNNSGSDENRSESEANGTTGKKKSAYSLAPNRVSCPYCFRKFPWSSSLRRHVLTHTGQKPYKCPHCPLLFTTKSNCDRHLLRKHGGTSNSGPAPGTQASETSPNGGSSSGASYTMRNVPERPYKCNFCPSSTFSTQSNLKKHVATKHSGTSSGPVSPTASVGRSSIPGEDGCHARSDSRDGGDESHASGSEDAEEPRVAATEFGTPAASTEREPPEIRPTPEVSRLTSESHHYVTTSSDLPFKCHLCEGSYAERQEALDHIKDSHPSEFELLVSKGALESAASEDNNNINSLAAHDDANGGEESLEQLRGKFPDYANRKVMCAFCMRRFWSAEDLRRHMRTHTGERPFSCDICRRRFTLKHSMLRHRKKHSSGAAYCAAPEDVSTISGDEDVTHGIPNIPEKSLKMTIPKVTNHNNNNITTTATTTTAKGINHEYLLGSNAWKEESGDFTASAAQILSSKFSGERKDDGEEDTDLIGNLLGIQDKSIIDKMLQSKSADDAAKLLGVKNGSKD